MVQLREVSTAEKIIFPVMLLMLVALLLPDAAPLLGMFAFGIRNCVGRFPALLC
jgi:oxaloacetate decarboxylase beta subunit